MYTGVVVEPSCSQRLSMNLIFKSVKSFCPCLFYSWQAAVELQGLRMKYMSECDMCYLILFGTYDSVVFFKIQE